MLGIVVCLILLRFLSSIFFSFSFSLVWVLPFRCGFSFVSHQLARCSYNNITGLICLKRKNEETKSSRTHYTYSLWNWFGFWFCKLFFLCWSVLFVLFWIFFFSFSIFKRIFWLWHSLLHCSLLFVNDIMSLCLFLRITGNICRNDA